MIKLIVFDIDGVLTDGSYLIDTKGNEFKKINFKDLDSFTKLKQLNIDILFLTGEKNYISEYFYKKFQPTYFIDGAKDKIKILKDFCTSNNLKFDDICYIGDGKNDIDCMKKCKISIAPLNAITEVKNVANYNLNIKGGDGVVYEVYNIIKNITTSSNNDLKQFNKIINEHNEILRKIWNDDILKQKIDLAINIIKSSLENKKMILVCGNGGSAADAQHFVAELVSKFNYDRKSLGAIALTTNSSILTSIGNDYDFDNIFKRQIEGLGKENDVLIAISTSGNSTNIKLAIEEAIKRNMKVILLTSEICNYKDDKNLIILKVPSEKTPRIQEIHIMIIHYICEIIEKYFLKEKNE